MEGFTPISAAIGGALIGVAATLLMLLLGRVAGIAGIFAGLLPTAWGDHIWRSAFIAGLLAAPIAGGFVGYRLPEPALPKSWAVIIVAGLLVGFGARLGGGCTSGHGVCGIARLSPRSIAATAIFIVFAILVVAVNRHVLGG
jgi:uncharacterized membrane protein YedE/YeeE